MDKIPESLRSKVEKLIPNSQERTEIMRNITTKISGGGMPKKFLCTNLDNGAILLGWLGFLSAVIGVVGWSMSFGHITEELSFKSHDVSLMQKIAFPLDIALIVFYIIEAVVSVLLIYGPTIRKRGYILPWLVFRAIQLLGSKVMWATIAYLLSLSPKDVNLITLLAVGAAVLAFNIYCYICVVSLFRAMKNSDEYQNISGDAGAFRSNYGIIGTTFLKIRVHSDQCSNQYGSIGSDSIKPICSERAE